MLRVFIVLAVVVLAFSASNADPQIAYAARFPCGRSPTPALVRHVIWIWMENHGYDQVVGSPAAPYENELGQRCGLATNAHGIMHPSLPNYIAATSGSTHGITDDANPRRHPLGGPSIYTLVEASGQQWRDYEESSSANCPQADSGMYAVRHDPAPYYTNVRRACGVWDEPLGSLTTGHLSYDLRTDHLPAFAFITPDLCHDTHNCSITDGDSWLGQWVPAIVGSPSYREGTTVIVITWDEDEGTSVNRIPMIVVSPSTLPGTKSATEFTHYSLLRTTEELLGLGPLIGHAGDPTTATMTAAFNL